MFHTLRPGIFRTSRSTSWDEAVMWLCVPSLSRDIANRLVADVEASAQLISKPVIGHAIYEPKGHFSGTLPSFLGLPSVSLSAR